MRASRTARALHLAGSAALVLVLSACGAPTNRPPTGPAVPVDQTVPITTTTTSTSSGSVDSSPTRRRHPGSGGGLASPIRVPIGGPDVEGWSLSEVEDVITAAIASGCGGEQCVGIALVNDDNPDNDNPDDCDVIEQLRGEETDDDGSLYVALPRGGDLVLEVNIRCADVGKSGADGADGEEGTDGAGTDGTPGEVGEATSTGTRQPDTGSG